MRIIALLAAGVVVALGLWLWVFGGSDAVSQWAAEGQQNMQQAMAGYLRALKRGDGGALAALLGLCFAYGFFHAAGPGHGKLVIGGYGMAARISALKLSGLALASSLAQSATAVALVGTGVLIFGWSRRQLTEAADQWLAPISMAAISLVGLWLFWRGVKAYRHTQAHTHAHDHDHHHDYDHDHHHDHSCSSCGHSHGPSLEESENVSNWRDAVAIVGSVALRPCTGAVFLLIITWSMGIFAAGVLGAFVMGIGTASITIAVALGSVFLRTHALNALQGNAQFARASALIQCAAGLLIAVLAAQMALAGIS